MSRAASGAGDAAINYSFVHISDDEVLAQSDVRAIAQDKEGFIWFGLRLGGLARYDGYEIKVHQHDAANAATIGNPVIWSLLVDHLGVLWIGTEGGLDRYDRNTNSFVHYRQDPNRADSLANNVVVCLFEDSSHHLWAGTRGGLCRLDDREKGTFTTFHRPQAVEGSMAKDTFRSIIEDPATGLLWLGSTDGLAAFDPRTGAFASFVHDQAVVDSLIYNAVNKVIRDADGTFWAMTESGLDSFVPQFDRVEHHSLQQPQMHFRHFIQPSGVANPGINFVRDGIIDNRNRFWLATRAGVQLFDRKTGTFVGFRLKKTDPSSLSDDLTQAVFIDRAGNLWVGTYHGGPNLLRANAKPFHVYRHDPSDSHTLSEDRIAGLALDPAGKIWAATSNGLSSFDPSNSVWTRFLHDPSDPNSIPTNELSTVAIAPNGDVWIGSNYDGLYRFDHRQFNTFPISPSNVPSPNGWRSFTGTQVHSILPDDKGGAWIGARGYGLDYYSAGRFLHYNPQEGTGKISAQPTTNVSFGFFTPDGALWFATESNGLIRFTPSKREFSVFQPPSENPGSSININHVIRSRDGMIWIGAANGLIKFDPVSERFVKRYSSTAGLPHSAVMAMVEDRRGHLWLGTANGLADFDPATEKIRTYEKPDGLPSNVFAQRSGVVGFDGTVYLGTRAGIVAFKPEELQDNPTAPPVVFSELRWVGPSVGEHGSDDNSVLNFEESLRVPPGRLGFTIKFSALDFTAPEKNRFRYRLEGLETGWSNVSSRERSVTYTSLPPGNYTFRVQASNADLIWNERGASIGIIVQPYFWQTLWFRIASVLLFTAVLLSALQWRLRAIRRHNLELEKQVQVRTGQLQSEVSVRQTAEAALRESHSELERRVLTRTAELAQTNTTLQAEIAERKNIEAQLRQSQKMEAIGQLAGGVAHDFNNLLTVILGQSEMLTDPTMPPASRAAAVRDIHASAERATNLTRQLLVFSRHQAMNPVGVDLNDVVADVTKLLRHIIGEHISLETNLSSEVLGVLADQGMIEQVLLNMAVNARDSMPRGGRLIIATQKVSISAGNEAGRPAGNYAQFSVIDSGAGIPADIRSQIFEPFFTTKEAGKGTGLGLAISLGIIQQHRGWIDVESTVGVGTTFHACLPLHALVNRSEIPERHSIAEASAGSTVLLAEDETGVRSVVRHILTRQGYHVIEASSGAEALALWAAHRDEISILLTDIVMPGWPDGRELAAKLLDEKPGLRVIMMSGYDPGENIGRGLERPYLRKPFTAEDLLNALDSTL